MVSLALFDFDGTITTSGTWLPFIERAVARRRMMVGRVVLAPLILGYKLGVVSSSHMREHVVRFGLRGRVAAEIKTLGSEYARTEIPKVVRAEALRRLDWHRGRGDSVVIVSASLDVYLAHWTRSQGLELICTELEERDGILTGRYQGLDCSGPEKSARVRAKFPLTHFDEIFAYGDSEEDAEMLSLASKRYFQWRER